MHHTIYVDVMVLALLHFYSHPTTIILLCSVDDLMGEWCNERAFVASKCAQFFFLSFLNIRIQAYLHGEHTTVQIE